MKSLATWWKFILSTALLGLVVIIAAEFIHTVNDDRYTHAQNVRLFQLVQKQNSDYASDRAALLHDQRVLLSNVQELRAQQNASAVRQQQLLAYMHRLGIRIPVDLILSAPAPTVVAPQVVAPQVTTPAKRPTVGPSGKPKQHGHTPKKHRPKK